MAQSLRGESPLARYSQPAPRSALCITLQWSVSLEVWKLRTCRRMDIKTRLLRLMPSEIIYYKYYNSIRPRSHNLGLSRNEKEAYYWVTFNSMARKGW